MSKKCPCGSQQLFSECCQPIHKNIYLAQTPLQLMKSRYSAYVMGNIDYLKISHQRRTRKKVDFQDIRSWTNSVVWMQLEIIATEMKNDNEGFVTFKAFFREHGKLEVIYEKSRFLRQDGHWVYVDGQFLN